MSVQVELACRISISPCAESALSSQHNTGIVELVNWFPDDVVFIRAKVPEHKGVFMLGCPVCPSLDNGIIAARLLVYDIPAEELIASWNVPPSSPVLFVGFMILDKSTLPTVCGLSAAIIADSIPDKLVNLTRA
jgi:hypothetical protein